MPNSLTRRSLLGSSFAAFAQKAAPKPNVFFDIDDLRPELGCYGNPHHCSPNIDPQENANVAEAQPELVNKLMEQWRGGWRAAKPKG